MPETDEEHLDRGQELLAGENVVPPDPQAIRHWIAIYSELVAYQSSLDPAGTDERAVGELDRVVHERNLRHNQSRLDYWRRRLLEVEGVELNLHDQSITHEGRTLNLTRRETQLLRYLLDHPNLYFSADTLLRVAWERPDLAPEQIRTYVVRLRAKLRTLGVPCQLVTRPGLGYCVTWEEPEAEETCLLCRQPLQEVYLVVRGSGTCCSRCLEARVGHPIPDLLHPNRWDRQPKSG